MRSFALCFVVSVLFSVCHTQGPDKNVHCLECKMISMPEDCHNQIECSSGEVCMAEQYVTDSGHIFYDVGCKMASTCGAAGYNVSAAEIKARIQSQTKGHANNPIIGRKRQGDDKFVHSCIECCEDDFCNNYLCGGHVTMNLKCLSCLGAPDMSYCDTLQTCNPHEVCYVQEELTDQFHLVYNSGCIRELQCESFLNNLQSMGGVLSDPCFNCCNDSFCNAVCPVYPSITTPKPSVPTTVCPTFPLSKIPKTQTVHNSLVTLGCGGMEEIVFLVDNSKIVPNQEEHWFEIFVRAFVDSLDLGPGKTRFAHAYYNEKEHIVIPIEKGDNSEFVDTKLQSVTYNRGPLVNKSDMGEAINAGVRMITGRYSRPGAKKYLVVLTEDDISDMQATIAAASRAKNVTVDVIIIGVGNFSRREEADLRNAVTSPSDKHLFLYNKFDGLRKMLQDIVLSKCEKSQVTATLLPDPCVGPKLINFLGCGAKEDITLILDRSGSIGTDWKQINTFVHELVSKFNISPNTSRLGMMAFNNHLTELIQLHEYPDKTRLLTEIDKKLGALKAEGNTFTALALDKAIEWYDKSGRDDAVKVVIIFTDGGSHTKFGTVAGALELQRRNVTMFVIGIGHDVDIKEQLILASDPDAEHMINVKDVNGLLLYLDYLAAIRCKEIANQSTSTVSPSTTSSSSGRLKH